MDKNSIMKRIWLIHCFLGVVLAVNPSENEIHGHDIKTHHPNPKSPASVLPLEGDLLKMINVSSKDQGVSVVEGPISKFTAFKFRLPYNSVPLTNSSLVISNLNSPVGFTLVFLIRQQKNNLGTLLSVNSPGRLTPWLQLTSNSKTGILTLKYKYGKKLAQIDWSLTRHHRKSLLAAWTWISVSVDYKNDVIRLDLDCSPSDFQNFTYGTKREKIEIPRESLIYFGQEPGRKKKFLGSVQVAKVLPYVTDERLWSCVQISQNLAPEIRKPIL